MIKSIHYSSNMLNRRAAKGIDAVTTLADFALITFMVEPAALRPHIHDRFELDCIVNEAGERKALISVVPFVDQDFRFASFPWWKWRFGQTNYRAYVTDRETGEHVVWFFGTTLDSWTVAIPRYLWRIPWHRANMQFDTEYDVTQNRYTRYQQLTVSDWAPAGFELADSGQSPQTLSGFPDLETGLVVLTHPLYGYYYRRDGSLGSYSIWHDKLNLTEGKLVQGEFQLLARLGLVALGDVSQVHSVLIQPETEFTIYLPPKEVLATHSSSGRAG